MRILFVASAGYKYHAERYYTTNRRVYNGLVRNGHDVYWFSDRDELRARTPFGLRNLGRARTNEGLLKTIANFVPDAVLLVHADIIKPSTLAEIKTRWPHIRIGQFIIDPVFNPHNTLSWQARLDHVDAHFFTTAGAALAAFSKHGRPCYFVPNATDASFDTGKAFELEHPRYDVACIMSPTSDTKLRDEVAFHIQQALPQLRYCYRGFNQTPPLRGYAFIEAISQSAIGLNLSQYISDGGASTQATRYLYSSDRIGQLMGNGCLTFISDQFSLQEILSDQEAVFFGDTEDAVDKVDFYTKNVKERQRIAHNGWVKAHRDFNERLVAQFVVERLCGQPLSHAYAWPTEANVA